jgi:tol-pal system protein YbgF
MRDRGTLLILLAVAILAPACATRGSVRAVAARVEQVAKDVGDLRRQHDSTAADIGPTVIELRMLNARLRDTEARLRDTLDRVAALGNRVAATEASLRELISVVEALPRVAPVPPAAAAPEPAPPPPAESSVTAERAFAAALKTFRSGEHGQAVLELTDFIGRYPTHPLVARAQLWIGEAYFKQRDYRQALLEFRKAVDAAPDTTAAAYAWLKIGQAYAALRERPAAAAAFQHVLREYPGSDAADRARTLLRK